MIQNLEDACYVGYIADKLERKNITAQEAAEILHGGA